MGTEITIMRGHPMNEGARGETEYNEKLIGYMEEILTSRGYDVYVHNHTVSSYGTRQDNMASAVGQHQPHCKVVFEAHYNSYSDESAHGHEFLYGYTKSLAESVQRAFTSKYPRSTPRSGGVKQVISGNGAGFLIKAPAASLIAEPFFESNHEEWDFFKDRQYELALVYTEGIIDYLGDGGEPEPEPARPAEKTLEERVAILEVKVAKLEE